MIVSRLVLRGGCFVSLFLLAGCRDLSFNQELAQTQSIVKELTGDDICYESELDSAICSVPQKLSRDEAIRIALLKNKDLRVNLYELGIAKMNLEDALLFQNPLIAIAYGDLLNKGDLPVTGIDSLIVVETQILNVPDLIQIPLRRSAYSTQLEIAIYSFVAKMVDTIAQTRQAYDKVVLNRALIGNLEEVIHAKEEPKKDYFTHEKNLTQHAISALIDRGTKIKKLSYKQELITALAELRVLLGIEQESIDTIELTSSLTEPLTPLPRLPALMSWAEHSHVDMVIAQKKIQYASEMLAYEKSKWFDRVSLGTTFLGETAHNAGNSEFKHFVGPYVAAALPLFHQNQPRIVQAGYFISKAERELEDKREKLKASLFVVHEKIILQKEIVSLYEESLQVAEYELTVGMQKEEKKTDVQVKKRLALLALQAQVLKARYKLLELYTAFEKTCGKRIFFAQKTVMPQSAEEGMSPKVS